MTPIDIASCVPRGSKTPLSVRLRPSSANLPTGLFNIVELMEDSDTPDVPPPGGDPAQQAQQAQSEQAAASRARFMPDHMLPDPERGKALLYRMLLIRRFEERAGEMYARAKIGGFLHLCIGEEATVVGTTAAMRGSDYLISTYREHGQVLARGTPPNAVMAELFGRVDGVSKGRGGSMHMFDAERRFMGGYGIVGGHLPIAAGLALGSVYQGTDDAVVCMLGDGATNQGTFGETLNLAALWRLPVVFIIVNNQFGMGTSVARHSAVTDLSAKGEGFGVPGTRCDGMDVLDVESCVRTALEHVRTERNPLLIEAVTYRFRGHSMADPEEYRTKQEVEEWRRRDPIMQFANRLIGAGAITGADAEQLDRQALAEVDASVQFADQSPFPALDSLYENVYVLGDQLRGWYSVDTRSPGAIRGEQIGGDVDLQRLAEAGAAHDEATDFGEQIQMRAGGRRDAVADGAPPPLPLPPRDGAGEPSAAEGPAQTAPPPLAPSPEQESSAPAPEPLPEPPPLAPPGAALPPAMEEVRVEPLPAPDDISFEPLPTEDDDYGDDGDISFEPLPHEEDDLSFSQEQGHPPPLPLPDETLAPLPTPDDAYTPPPLPIPGEAPPEPGLLPPEADPADEPGLLPPEPGLLPPEEQP